MNNIKDKQHFFYKPKRSIVKAIVGIQKSVSIIYSTPD